LLIKAGGGRISAIFNRQPTMSSEKQTANLDRFYSYSSMLHGKKYKAVMVNRPVNYFFGLPSLPHNCARAYSMYSSRREFCSSSSLGERGASFAFRPSSFIRSIFSCFIRVTCKGGHAAGSKIDASRIVFPILTRPFGYILHSLLAYIQGLAV